MLDIKKAPYLVHYKPTQRPIATVYSDSGRHYTTQFARIDGLLYRVKSWPTPGVSDEIAGTDHGHVWSHCIVFSRRYIDESDPAALSPAEQRASAAL
jgi:hypothetical protein